MGAISKWDFENSAYGSLLSFGHILQNDERMHHYQRRRTSITGLVL